MIDAQANQKPSRGFSLPNLGRKLWVVYDKLAAYPLVVLLLIIASFTAPMFARAENFLNISQQVAVLAVLTVAETLVLLTGRFDLSLESTIGFAPMLAAWLMVDPSVGGLGTEFNGYVGLAVALGVSLFIGWFNGFLIVKLRLNPFIATLGMLVFLRGAMMIITSGKSIYSPSDVFTWAGSERVLGVVASVWIAIIIAFIAQLFTQRHRLGRALYALGGNERAAHAAGVNVDRMVWGAYIMASLLAGVAGILLSGRLDSVLVTQGSGMIFNVFAAAVIGGVSLQGGKGTIVGAMSGVILLGMLANFLTLAQVPSFYVDAARGAIIIIAMIIAAGAERFKASGGAAES
jgi:simple sugar transport system permease protein